MIELKSPKIKTDSNGAISKELFEEIVRRIQDLTEEELDLFEEKYGTDKKIPGSCYSIYDECMKLMELEKNEDFEKIINQAPENLVQWFCNLSKNDQGYLFEEYGEGEIISEVTISMYYEFIKWKESNAEN
ncbi:hypothetical protein [Methanolapillus millepedarum]|uniref:Uncharacterized protein n=1 Tax=Methanolapillus millepedarum TaxID=3028296 RepID=A0AA96V401_9EURY|nr:hypothetical protein MsAc7_08170 [Methanosarcinaceae archaeon Ac7]